MASSGNKESMARPSRRLWLVGGIVAGLLLLAVFAVTFGRSSSETAAEEGLTARAGNESVAGSSVEESTDSSVNGSAISEALCESEGETYYCDVSLEIVRTSEYAGVITVDYTWVDGEVECTERADVREFDDGSLEILAYGYEHDCGGDRHPASVAHEKEIGPSDTEIEQAICRSIPGSCVLQRVETVSAWDASMGGVVAEVAVIMKFDGSICGLKADLGKGVGIYPSKTWTTLSSVKDAYERCTS